MPTDKSYQSYLNLLSSKKTDLGNQTLSLVSAITAEKRQDIAQPLSSVIETARSLSDLLLPEDRPSWLKQYLKELELHHAGKSKNLNLVMSVVKHFNTLQNYQFKKTEAKNYIDFESIFQLALAESNVPKLFDELIIILNKIKDSNEINNKAMLDALELLIESIKIGKKQSFVSIISSKRFIEKFLREYTHELATKTPVLGDMYKAFVNTYAELDDQITNLQSNSAERIEGKIQKEIINQQVTLNTEAIDVIENALEQHSHLEWFDSVAKAPNTPNTMQLSYEYDINKDDTNAKKALK